MKTTLPSVAGAAILCLATASRATADPITITAGSLLVTGFSEVGSISLDGTRGFSLRSPVAPTEGAVLPINFCGFEGCLPGETIRLDAFLGGPALPGGVITVDGHTFEDIGSLSSIASIALDFQGSLTLPAFADSPMVVSGAFTLAGLLSVLDAPELGGPLFGAGAAFLSLVPSPAESGLPRTWVVDQVRYDFAEPAPVPEPATMVLVGTGVAAAFLRHRRRQRRGDG